MTLDEFKASMAAMANVDLKPAPNRCAADGRSCRGDGSATVFTDDLSRKEYSISGMCQACQDVIFAEPDDEPTGDEPAF